MSDIELLMVIIIAVLSGMLGGGGVAGFLARANANTQLKDSTEQLLAKSVPQDALDIVHDIVVLFTERVLPVAEEAAAFIEDVTDGTPNTR